MSKLKTGDRVVINENCSQREWIGLEGVVEEQAPILRGTTALRVKLDKPVPRTYERGYIYLGPSKFTLVENTSYIPEDWS